MRFHPDMATGATLKASRILQTTSAAQRTSAMRWIHTTFNDIYRHDARMNGALNGKGYVPDPWAQEVMAGNQAWDSPPNKRNRPRPGRNSNDFTRTLFGF